MVSLHGLPLVTHAVRSLLSAGCVRHVVVAAPPDYIAPVSGALASFDAVSVVAGGEDRTASVRLALSAALTLIPDAKIVLVHDVDRALTPPAQIRSVADAVGAGNPAVVPVLPVTDTVKRVNATGVVLSTADRTGLRALQSPQGFEVEVLRRACVETGGLADFTAKVDVPVLTVPGDVAGMKITTPFDLTVAEAVAAR